MYSSAVRDRTYYDLHEHTMIYVDSGVREPCNEVVLWLHRTIVCKTVALGRCTGGTVRDRMYYDLC